VKYVPRLHVNRPPRLWAIVGTLVLLFATVLTLDRLINIPTLAAWMLGLNLLGQCYLMWYLMNHHIALPNVAAPATPYDRWTGLYNDRRQLAATRENQIALATAQGQHRQAEAVRQQMLAELQLFDEQCASLLEQIHSNMLGATTAQRIQELLRIMPDGSLPVLPQLIELANQPVHTPMTLAERLPLQALAHRIASDPRQGERLREYATAVSGESPATTKLTLAMRWFVEAICANSGVERCSRCYILKVAEDCQRCAA